GMTLDAAAIAEIQDIIQKDSQIAVLPRRLLREGGENVMLDSMAVIYCMGHQLNWSELYRQGANFVKLPSYPWRRESCSLIAGKETTSEDRSSGCPLTTSRLPQVVQREHNIQPSAEQGTTSGRSEGEIHDPAAAGRRPEEWFYQMAWKESLLEPKAR